MNLVQWIIANDRRLFGEYRTFRDAAILYTREEKSKRTTRDVRAVYNGIFREYRLIWGGVARQRTGPRLRRKMLTGKEWERAIRTFKTIRDNLHSNDATATVCRMLEMEGVRVSIHVAAELMRIMPPGPHA